MASAAEGKIALVTVEDCVQCAAAVLRGSGHENMVYNITGPELLSFRDVAAMSAKISNRPVEYKVVSDDEMYAMWDSLGIPREYVEGLNVAKAGKWSSNDMVSFEQAIREGYFAVISQDVKKLLGREPTSVWDVFQAHQNLFELDKQAV
jgi:NAD(P)H dehydrogenase (quinone)